MKKIIPIILALLMLCMAACATTPLDDIAKDAKAYEDTANKPADTAASATPVDGSYTAEEIFEKFGESCVFIEANGSGGSGFFIEENIIATNNHVAMCDSEYLNIKTIDGQVYPVKAIIAHSENPDLALLEIEGSGVPLTFSSRPVKEGQTIYTIGAPMGIYPTMSNGMVMKHSHIDNDVDYILSNIHSIGGNSGGAVLNEYGELIGLVVGGMMDGPNSIDLIINAKHLAELQPHERIELTSYDEYMIEFNKPEEEKYELAELESAQAGQLVRFGHYEQDNNTDNGAEEILWLVRDISDGKMTLTSLYALDVIPYNPDGGDTTWETSYLRQFLNNDFFNAAFTEEEQGKISDSLVVTDDNPIHGTDGGADTVDKVYIPSLEEIRRYYNIVDIYEAPFGGLYAPASEYAISKGAWLEIPNSNRCWWWLRSPGGNQANACEVGSGGYLSYNGTDVFHDERAVLPVIQINIG